jgi:hypothetical protein
MSEKTVPFSLAGSSSIVSLLLVTRGGGGGERGREDKGGVRIV